MFEVSHFPIRKRAKMAILSLMECKIKLSLTNISRSMNKYMETYGMCLVVKKLSNFKLENKYLE